MKTKTKKIEQMERIIKLGLFTRKKLINKNRNLEEEANDLQYQVNNLEDDKTNLERELYSLEKDADLGQVLTDYIKHLEYRTEFLLRDCENDPEKMFNWLKDIYEELYYIKRYINNDDGDTQLEYHIHHCNLKI